MKGAKADQIHDLKLETRREFLKKDNNLGSAFTANAVSQNNKGCPCKQQQKAVRGYCTILHACGLQKWKRMLRQPCVIPYVTVQGQATPKCTVYSCASFCVGVHT